MSTTTPHDADHSDHPEWLQHHFYTAEQQYSASKLGMWLFLAQEVLFFGGLFVAYTFLRYMYPETLMYAHEFLDWKLGSINTLVLITSSLTMALGVRAAQLGNIGQLKIHLVITFVLAGVFLVIKYIEYSHKFHGCLLPGDFYGLPFQSETGEWFLNPVCHEAIELRAMGARAPQMFFSLYFAMTGLHGIHVLGGMVVIAWLLIKANKGHFSAAYSTPVEIVGLYWHLVDLIWIFLFPLLYLVR